MKILIISDEVRHELGCAAALILRGYKVVYIHVGEERLPLMEKIVRVDEGIVKVPFIGVKRLAPFASMASIRKVFPNSHEHELSNVTETLFDFDVIISTPGSPFYVAYYFAKKLKAPLILRIWGIRANKLIDFVVYGKKYTEFLNFYPSVLHNLLQSWNSQTLVALDDATRNFLNRLPTFKRKFTIYPTYAEFYEPQNLSENENFNHNLDLLEKERYIFSIVMSNRVGASFRAQEYTLLAILYHIAKSCPNLKVIIAGARKEEIKSKTSIPIPRNIIFCGRIHSDNFLKMLYERAELVVIPIFLRSVSNRLLEALYYRKPIITNSIAKLVHNKLEHQRHILIADNYQEYPQIIKSLLREDILLKRLSLGAEEAYRSYFSARRCGLLMKHVIEAMDTSEANYV